MKILWRSDKDKITFKAIEKHRYGLQKTVSKHLKMTSVDMFPRSQSSQIPAFIRNYTSEIACFLTLLDVYILSLPLKANLIKTTAFMAFLGESFNILNFSWRRQSPCWENKGLQEKHRKTGKNKWEIRENREKHRKTGRDTEKQEKT